MRLEQHPSEGKGGFSRNVVRMADNGAVHEPRIFFKFFICIISNFKIIYYILVLRVRKHYHFSLAKLN